MTVDYPGIGGPVTLIYIFSPNCIWCSRNLPNIKTLVSKSGDKYRFVGLSLSKDELQNYIKENKLNFPIYSEPTAEVISAYKLGGTPRTLIVSPEGQILKNWSGAYGGDVKREVEAYFQISLPGIADGDANKKKDKNENCESCNEKSIPQS